MMVRLQWIRPLGRQLLDCAVRRLVSGAVLQCLLPRRRRGRKPVRHLMVCVLQQVALSCLGGLALRLVLGNAVVCGSVLGGRLAWLARGRVLLTLGWGVRG